MNFGRILNIFIILFLVANIILYGLYEHESKEDYTLTSEKEVLLREVLGENNMCVYCLLPEFRPMEVMEVKLRNIDENKIRKQIFGDVKVTFKGLKQQYSYKNETLTICKGTKEGFIYYTNDYDKQVKENFNKSDIEDIGSELIKKLTTDNNLVLTCSQPDDDNKYFQLEYNDSFKGQTIFNNSASLIFYEDGKINGIVLNDYEPIRFKGESKEIYPVDEVLYQFMHSIREKDSNELIRIMGIDIGYYVSEEDITSEEDIIKAEPCYRIRLGNNEVHYINAYTNKNISYRKSEFGQEDYEN
ncbi:hypothetical protein SH1V18_11580 [Vallitalea longa]|uniref:Uncharacterized protein n=1 Tax=Vallitalea longa TaxID=2936439 RepID=A0A9W5YCE0_9FIRM|nr:hypothetical protein [Vallitalea longa]GKX28678.1 hypothetical protein SH1V18_11580 [Vallitalea longa]